MNSFYQKWMTLWCAGVALFGLILAGGAFAATDGLCRAVFTLFGNPIPAAPDDLHRFAIGLMGAVTFGWGATLWVGIKAFHLLPAAQAAPLWRQTVVAASLWYVIDSTISVATGYGMNAVSNTLFMVLLLVPVVRSGVMRAG